MKEQLIELVKKSATSLDKNDRLSIAIYSMGLVGEIGEVIKAYPVSQKEFKTELADVVWYSVALSVLLGREDLLDDIAFNNYTLVDGKDGEEFLRDALMESLKYLEKAKKYVRDYPDRPIESLNEYITPLKFISDVFDLSDCFYILNKKLGKRYPNGFVIDPIRE